MVRKFRHTLENFSLVIRGYGIIQQIYPTYLLISTLHAFVDSAIPAANLYLSAGLFNVLLYTRDGQTIALYITLLLGANVVLGSFQSMLSHSMEAMQQGFQYRCGVHLFEHVMKVPFPYVEQNWFQSLSSEIAENMNAFGGGLVRLCYAFPELARRLFGIVLSLWLVSGVFLVQPSETASFFASPLMTCLCIALVCLVFFLNIKVMRRSENKQQMILADLSKLSVLSMYYDDYVKTGQAGKEVRIYGQSGLIMKILKERFAKIRFFERISRTKNIGSGTDALSNAIIKGILYIFLGLRALIGMYEIGFVYQYVGAAGNLILDLASFVKTLTQIWGNLPYLEKTYALLDISVETEAHSVLEASPTPPYTIEFHHVSFQYPGTEANVLQDVTFRLNEGSRWALVGENGCGKTTLIKLICRLYDPTQGYITFGGVDIRRIPKEEYRRLLSVVFQDFKLLAFSLGQNIAASRSFDPGLVEKAIEKVQLKDFLQSLPNGLDTILYKDFEPNGIQVSGGEAQKIAIARSIYRNAPVLILDEPTAALDPISEYHTYQYINNEVRSSLVLFISHRLSSCRFCDQILVLHQGRLIQSGTHQALLTQMDGKYRELWDAQAQYYQE